MISQYFFLQMCPIVGERYRCKDCVEKIGFDLCQNCYQSSSKLPGRFNQQHREDHKFEKVAQIHLNHLILRVDNFDDYDDDRSIDHENTEAVEPETTLPANNPSSEDAIRNTSNTTSENQECLHNDDSRT